MTGKAEKGPRGLVARILESSFIDGPGHRAVVFMQGCGMRCSYCHNPETRGICDSCGICLAACPAHALSRDAEGLVQWNKELCCSCDACIEICPKDASPRAQWHSPESLMKQLSPLEPFIDGVTFSGGECLLQGDFVLAASEALHSLRNDLFTIADTNGAAPAADFIRFLSGLDGFIFDLKAWNPEVHTRLTGVPPQLIRDNLGLAAKAGKLVEVRTVLVEGCNDSAQDLEASARFLAGQPGGFPWRLLPFRPQGVRGSLADSQPYPYDKLDRAIEIGQKILGDRVLGPALRL